MPHDLTPSELAGAHVVGAAVYADGRRVAEVRLDEAHIWMRRPGHFVWIGLQSPDESTMRLAQEQFGLHDLAVEDSLKAHQRPKLERFGDTLFAAVRTADLAEDGRRVIGEMHAFVGDGFVLTVSHGEAVADAEVRARCEATPEMLRHGEDFVLYALLDRIVDHYDPVVEAMEGEAAELEDLLLRCPPSPELVERMIRIRRDLAGLRRAVSPLLDICYRLERLELPAIDAAMHPYYRDIHDHVMRLNEAIDILGEALAFAFEAGMMVSASRQNDTIRRLAAWAAMLAAPTAIAGIYGMNFEYMPELAWRYGYFAVLVVIAVVEVVLYRRFRRLGWL